MEVTNKTNESQIVSFEQFWIFMFIKKNRNFILLYAIQILDFYLYIYTREKHVELNDII